MDSKQGKWGAWWWLIPVLLWATFISIIASKDFLFIDEIRSVQHLGWAYGQNTLSEVVASIAYRSSQHAPGYFFLLRGWSNLVGFSPFALRFLSILFGVLGIACLYRLGRDFFSREVGFIAAFMLSADAFYIFYMHEMRMYSAFIMLIVIELWLYHRVAVDEKEPRAWHWFGLFANTVFLINTHYHAIFPLLGLGFYHLILAPKNKRWIMTGVMMVASGLVFLPWLPIVLRGTRVMTIGRPLLTGFSFFTSMIHQASNGTFITMLLMVIGAFAVVRRPKGKLLYLAIVFAVSIVMMYIVNETTFYLTEYRSARYYLALHPTFFLIAAFGILYLRRYRGAVFVILALWLVAGVIYMQTENFRYYNNRGIEQGYIGYPPMTEISATLYQHDLVVPQNRLLILSNHEFIWRMQDEADYHLDLLRMQGRVVDDVKLDEIEVEGHLGSVGVGDDTMNIWLAYDPEQATQDTIEHAQTVLESEFEYCDTLVENRQLVMLHYVHKPFGCDLPEIPEEVQITYDGQAIELRSMQTMVDNDKAYITTAWVVDVSVPLHTYSVSLQIFNEDGDKVDQRDYGLQHSQGYWHTVWIDVSEKASGTYTVEAAVYNWRTGERLIGITSDDFRADSIAAGEFVVP